MMRSTLVLVMFAVLLTACGDEATPTAGLPSWNGGPARQWIVDFVATVTDPDDPAYVPPGERVAVVDYSLESQTGLVTFVSPPVAGEIVTAGFEFDVPVRFDTDRIEISLAAMEAGEIPSIPVVEVRV